MRLKDGLCSCVEVHEETLSRVKGVMPNEETLEAAAAFFRVMGDPTRFKLLYALDGQELCVCDLANLLQMSLSAVSHQLARLKKGKLVKSRRDGKNVFYSIADDHVHMMLKGCIDHAME